jgi:hypothetical protein
VPFHEFKAEVDDMSQTTSSWCADLLTWGKGPRVFEVFLEPICSFLAKAFGKLDEKEFEFTKHYCGPNMLATASDIIARIEKCRGVKLAEAFSIPNRDREIKWDTRYARQNGIHASPTFVIAMVQPDMSGGESVSDWGSRLSAS